MSRYNEIRPRKGENMALPEIRQEVLGRIMENVDRDGTFQQRYSNGEFITSSLNIGKTYESVLKMRTLECPGSTIHFDPVLEVFWRRAGCWD